MEQPTRDTATDKELTEILDIVDIVRSDPKGRGRYMGIMGVIDYERRDAYEAGIREGHASGIQEGLLRGTIDTLKFLKTDRAAAKDIIIEQFSITEEKAEEYLNLYW